MADSIKVEIPKELEDLIPNYLSGVKKSAEEMHQKLEAKDFETTRSMGHKLKGSGGGYGFDRISELGKEIEDQSKAENQPAVQAAIDSLKHYLENIEISYVDSDW